MNAIKLIAAPGRGYDDRLLHHLQMWMNERYEVEIASDPYFCKRVRFKGVNHHRPGSRWAAHAYATGKVTDAFFRLQDEELFRYEVTLDYTGEVVTGVSARDFEPSTLTDEQVRAEARRREAAASAPAVAAPRTVGTEPPAPVTAWGMTASGPTQVYGQRAERNRVRVMDAGRFPHLFLAEGYVTQTHLGGKDLQYGVRLDTGQTVTFHEKELLFL